VIVGLRGKVIATAVPSCTRSVARAAAASARYGPCAFSSATNPSKPAASARRAAACARRRSSFGSWVITRIAGDHLTPGNGGGGTGAAARGALCSQGGLWYRLGKPREVTAALAHVHA
jgi:hypothetical protein